MTIAERERDDRRWAQGHLATALRADGKPYREVGTGIGVCTSRAQQVCIVHQRDVRCLAATRPLLLPYLQSIIENNERSGCRSP